MYIYPCVQKHEQQNKIALDVLVVLVAFFSLTFPLISFYIFRLNRFQDKLQGTKWRMDYKEIGVELIKLHKKYQIKKKRLW